MADDDVPYPNDGPWESSAKHHMSYPQAFKREIWRTWNSAIEGKHGYCDRYLWRTTWAKPGCRESVATSSCYRVVG